MTNELLYGIALTVGTGTPVLATALWQVARNRVAQRWPVTTGTIDYVALARGNSDNAATCAAVQYTYEVNGVPYDGSRIAFGYLPAGADRMHLDVAERLRSGRRVRVHYDPARPHVSVLAPVTSGALRALLAFGTLIAWFMYAMLVAMLHDEGMLPAALGWLPLALWIAFVPVAIAGVATFVRIGRDGDPRLVAALDVGGEPVPAPLDGYALPPVPSPAERAEHARAAGTPAIVAAAHDLLERAPWRRDVVESPGLAGRPVVMSNEIRTTTAIGPAVVALAIAALVAGTWLLVGIHRGVIADRGDVGVVRFVAMPLAIGFVLMGASLLVENVRERRRAASRLAARRRHPAEPWRWDHEWDARGARAESGVRLSHLLVGLAVIAALVAPLYHALHGRLTGPTRGAGDVVSVLVLGLVAVAFTGLWLVGAGWALLRAARRAKFGETAARWRTFPFRRGTPVVLEVPAPAALRPDTPVTATLQCVEEGGIQFRAVGAYRRPRGAATAHEIFHLDAPATWSTDAAGRPTLCVSLDVPAGAPPTQLSRRPTRYWQVTLHSHEHGVRFAPRFLVPVY